MTFVLQLIEILALFTGFLFIDKPWHHTFFLFSLFYHLLDF